MGTSVVLNATSYTIPAVGEGNWGTQVTNYLVALSTGVLSKAGGSFTLTADTDFGANYGLKSVYYKSRGTASTVGIVRLANAEAVGWRNAANNANLQLLVNSSNVLEFNGSPIVTLALGAADTVLRMNAGGTAYGYGKITDANVDAAAAIAYSKLNLGTSIVNADISGSAAIAYSKLSLGTSIVNADISGSAGIAYSKLNLGTSIINADVATGAAIARSKLATLTASRLMVTDGSGVETVSAVTATEAGYLAGVTSNIQTQFAGTVTASSPTITTPLIDTINEATSTNGTSVKGRTSGTAISAGYIGQVITMTSDSTDSAVTSTANTYDNGVQQLTLTAGIWQIYLQAPLYFNLSAGTATSIYQATGAIRQGSTVIASNILRLHMHATTQTHIVPITLVATVQVTSSTAYDYSCKYVYIGGGSDTGTKTVAFIGTQQAITMYAVRVG